MATAAAAVAGVGPAAAAGPGPGPAAAAGLEMVTAAAAVAGGAGPGNQRRVRGSSGLGQPGTCSTSKQNSLISSSQRARNRLMSRLVHSHETAWLSVLSVKLDRIPGGRGAPLPSR